MNFPQAGEYLLSLGNEVSAMKLGLKNIRKLLAALDDPHRTYLKIQVAGTNGKGSVSAFLDSICSKAGINAGLYTSPHLVSITERIKIDGREITRTAFARHATTVRDTAEKLITSGDLENVPTFFEQITAIALLAFAEAKVDLAILETGLGGRLDATTAANAEIVAITQIDYDHQNYLGETLIEIAAEKAAIIRTDTQTILGSQKPQVGIVLDVACSDLGVTPKSAQDIEATHLPKQPSGNAIVMERVSPAVNFQTLKAKYENVCLSLLGRHQIENAKVAILLAETLQNYFHITTKNISDGLQSASHPGRLEHWKNFLFDGAHNVSGAKALRYYLDEFVHQPVTMIFGSMKDKDVNEIAKTLFPKANILILTQPDNSRAMPVEELSKFAPDEREQLRVIFATSVAEALKNAKELTPTAGLILITGSLYLVGEAKKILNNCSIADA